MAAAAGVGSTNDGLTTTDYQESIMAKSHYNADSASFPSLSLHRGRPGAGNENPVKMVDSVVLAVDHASPAPATHTPARRTHGYLGMNCHTGRPLQARTIVAGPGLSGPSPITACSIS
jgi:hypothetical protein